MPSPPVQSTSRSGWPTWTTISGALIGFGVGFAFGASGPLTLVAVGPGIVAGPTLTGLVLLLAALVALVSAVLVVLGLFLGYHVGRFATAVVMCLAILLGAAGGAVLTDPGRSEAVAPGADAPPTMPVTSGASPGSVPAASTEPTPGGPMPAPGPILLTLHVRSATGFDTWVAIVRGAEPIGKPWGLTETGVSVACLRLAPGERAVVLAAAPDVAPAVARAVLYAAAPGDIDPMRWIDIDARGAAIAGPGRPPWSDAVPDPCRFGDDLPG